MAEDAPYPTRRPETGGVIHSLIGHVVVFTRMRQVRRESIK